MCGKVFSEAGSETIAERKVRYGVQHEGNHKSFEWRPFEVKRALVEKHCRPYNVTPTNVLHVSVERKVRGLAALQEL